MWSKLSAHMGNRWAADRIESRTSNNVADVAYAFQGVNGWIEL